MSTFLEQAQWGVRCAEGSNGAPLGPELPASAAPSANEVGSDGTSHRSIGKLSPKSAAEYIVLHCVLGVKYSDAMVFGSHQHDPQWQEGC
eukprot:9495490-Pyramimonas_sp.AAC.2